MLLVDINYEHYLELSEWIDNNAAKTSISELDINYCIVTTEGNKLNSTLVFSWVPNEEKYNVLHNKDWDLTREPKGTPSFDRGVRPASLTAVKEKEEWQINSFQELW